MTFQTPASVDGRSKGESHANDSLGESEFTSVTTSSSFLVTVRNNQPKMERSSTPESAPHVYKRMGLTDNGKLILPSIMQGGASQMRGSGVGLVYDHHLGVFVIDGLVQQLLAELVVGEGEHHA